MQGLILCKYYCSKISKPTKTMFLNTSKHITYKRDFKNISVFVKSSRDGLNVWLFLEKKQKKRSLRTFLTRKHSTKNRCTSLLIFILRDTCVCVQLSSCVFKVRTIVLYIYKMYSSSEHLNEVKHYLQDFNSIVNKWIT